jgi:hypothetical protein
MKYTVSVSVEVDAENDIEAAALGFTLLNDETPRTLSIRNAAGVSKDIKLHYTMAMDLKRVGRAPSQKDLDRIIRA